MRRFIAGTTAALALGTLGVVGVQTTASAAPAAPAVAAAPSCGLHLYLDLLYHRYTLLCL